MKYLPILLVLVILGCDRTPPAVPQMEAKVVDVEWKDFSVGELTFETPLSLAAVSLEGHSGLLLFEGFEGTSSDRYLTVATIHQNYRKGNTIDLDGAAQGSITSVAANEGDPAPSVSISEMEISGVTAKRVVYEGNIRGRQTWIDSACVIVGQDLWGVIVVRRVKKQDLLTKRILNSIRLNDAVTSIVKVTPQNNIDEVKPPPYDPAYQDVEAWIKENDPGPLVERQRWWPVADQVAIYAELQPRYLQWRENNPGEQTPPDEFEDLYLHERENEANRVDEPMHFPQKLLRLRYFIEIDGKPLRKDRTFVLHDGKVRRIEEADIVFSKSYGILQSFRLDMLAPE